MSTTTASAASARKGFLGIGFSQWILISMVVGILVGWQAPEVAFQVLLPLVAPVIDVFAIHGLLTGSATRVTVLWLAYAGIGVATAGYALRLDGESLKPLWSLPLQQLFYRQLIYRVAI